VGCGLRHRYESIMRMLKLYTLMAGSCCALWGCAAAPKSTVMTVEDYEYIAREIAGNLRHSLVDKGFLAARRPDSPPIVVAVQKVVNLTSDIMTEPTKWYLMARVVNSRALRSLRATKNVRFTIPAEHLEEARKRGWVGPGFAQERHPTHAMTATFRSVTRSTGVDRTDLYYCQYEITDLRTGEVVWSDKVEFKRIAHGRTWD